MKSQHRGSRKGTARRIAATALRILEREGAEAVSMRRIADAVGITPMAIYHHYTSREDLLKRVTDAEFEKLEELSDALLAKRKSNLDLVKAVDAYVDYAFARPRVFDYVFSQPRFDARRFPRDFRERQSPTLNPLADLVSDGMKRGRLRHDDVWEVALQLWAHAHGYVMLHRAGRFAVDHAQFRALYHRAVERLLRGLLQPDRGRHS
jgi:AcrR family transcriptional regulator